MYKRQQRLLKIKESMDDIDFMLNDSVDDHIVEDVLRQNFPKIQQTVISLLDIISK